MPDIEPFEYQKSTNIEEHNQIVDKLNEIVEVINDTNLDTLNEKVTALESEVAQIGTDLDEIPNNYQPKGNYLTEVPIGGTAIGGVKNGGNVTINEDGTMNASGTGTGIQTNVLTYQNNKLKSTVNGVDSNEVEIVGGTGGGGVETVTIENDALGNLKVTVDDVSDTEPIASLPNGVNVYGDEMFPDSGNYYTQMKFGNGNEFVGRIGVSNDEDTVKFTFDNGQDVSTKYGNVKVANIECDTINGNEPVFGSGAQWEELDPTNLPSDFQPYDIILVTHKMNGSVESAPASWTTAPGTYNTPEIYSSAVFDATIFQIGPSANANVKVGNILAANNMMAFISLGIIESPANWNNTTVPNMRLYSVKMGVFNGGGISQSGVDITKSNIGQYVKSMFRLRPTKNLS